MDQTTIKSIVSYDPDTGDFMWLKRSLDVHRQFISPDSRQSDIHSLNLWNSTHAGKNIGSKINGYLEVRVGNSLHRLHRLAWLYVYGFIPDQIDHINGVRSDNKISNLRICTQALNCKNSAKRLDNTSGFTGVYFIKRLSKWAAKIVANGKQIHVGVFDTAELANKARKDALPHHGFHANHGRDQHSEYVRNGHEFHQCLITPLGQIEITKLWAAK